MLVIIVSYFIGSNNNQCLKNTGVWVGYELILPIKIFNKNSLYKDFESLYLKSNLYFSHSNQRSSCKIIYDWYEDGLSLNFLTLETRSLVFSHKIDGKYWFDIKNPETRKYILDRFKKYKTKYPKGKIHLDDHWSIPAQYGDYTKELNNLTKEIINITGPLSISVLPLNYSKAKYNANWLYWIENYAIEEVILQNYAEDNFDYEVSIFYNQVNKIPVKKRVGVYIRPQNKLVGASPFPIYIFSLRTSLLKDLDNIFNN